MEYPVAHLQFLGHQIQVVETPEGKYKAVIDGRVAFIGATSAEAVSSAFEAVKTISKGSTKMKNSNDKKPTHTPGPWTVNSQGRDLTHVNAPMPKQYSGLMTVAIVETTQLRNGDEVIGEAEKQANAVLIAAAPEMLEALEYIAFHAPKCKTPQELDRCMDTIKAAIRKAKGQV